MTPEEHKQRHIELHQALHELIADWISSTDRLPSQTTVMELMTWRGSCGGKRYAFQIREQKGQGDEMLLHKDELISKKILKVLNEHEGSGTVARIAFWIDSSAYEKNNEKKWKQWKEHVRITLHIMKNSGEVFRTRRSFAGDIWNISE